MLLFWFGFAGQKEVNLKMLHYRGLTTVPKLKVFSVQTGGSEFESLEPITKLDVIEKASVIPVPMWGDGRCRQEKTWELMSFSGKKTTKRFHLKQGRNRELTVKIL